MRFVRFQRTVVAGLLRDCPQSGWVSMEIAVNVAGAPMPHHLAARTGGPGAVAAGSRHGRRAWCPPRWGDGWTRATTPGRVWFRFGPCPMPTDPSAVTMTHSGAEFTVAELRPRLRLRARQR